MVGERDHAETVPPATTSPHARREWVYGEDMKKNAENFE
jgi:hypothetical protein